MLKKDIVHKFWKTSVMSGSLIGAKRYITRVDPEKADLSVQAPVCFRVPRVPVW